MEVMNRAELTQTDILVGNKSVTRSFGVSDDPMLMSMLSTGFYQNPLRTMIQEVMFNAWDAHRMGNCQHRPIDIYINEISGLVIRDYGPGIEPGEDDDNMHEIYCMYGGSTKRKLKNQTGGFGLGSKSPFAYTESFTVTSHFGGTKNMYLISRVSDANGGKPGMTSLVRVPTTETGLMVTVPLKAQDVHRAYTYLKELLLFSGVKAMIHFEEEADEFIDSEAIEAGQYRTTEKNSSGNIYAVYGGVKYRIPADVYYSEEFEFMKLLGKKKDIYVGFAPDTLSPLPNREGLNMGDKSRESVKAAFELCMEKFHTILEPLIKTFFECLFIRTKKMNLQPAFAFMEAIKYVPQTDASGMRGHMIDNMIKMIPDGVQMDIWKLGCDLCVWQTSSIMSVCKYLRWRTLFLHTFVQQYPEGKHIAFAALKQPLREVFPLDDHDKPLGFITELYRHRILRDQMKFYLAMKEAFPNDDSLHPAMRVYMDGAWVPVIQERSKAHLDKTKYGVHTRAGKSKNMEATDPRLARKDGIRSMEKLYHKKDGRDLTWLFMDKYVVLAKTTAMLNEATTPSLINDHTNAMARKYRYYDGVSFPVPGYVIHQRKGAYDKALEILKNMGFTVIEGDEPEKKVYVPKAKVIPTYSLIRPEESEHWCSGNPNDQITDPTHFFYATMATLKGYNSNERPEREMVHWFKKANPKLVMVNNVRPAEALANEGVISLDKGVEAWYAQVSADPDRMLNTIRSSFIMNSANLPNDLLMEPLIQLEMGMEPVDKTDAQFWYESQGYNLISGSRWYPIQTLAKNVKAQMENLWKVDPEKRHITHMCEVTKYFQEYAISSLWSSTKPADKPEMVDKIIAAMKLFM